MADSKGGRGVAGRKTPKSARTGSKGASKPKSKGAGKAKTASRSERTKAAAMPAAAAPIAKEPAAAPTPVASGALECSPLEGRPGAGRGTVVMVEHPHLGKLNLRGDPSDTAFAEAVKTAVGAAPPAANTVATAGRNALLWLGPDECLIVTPPGEQTTVEAALLEALAGRHVSVVDTSDARTTIRIHGAHARDVLAKGCPLDLHPRVFGPGQCAQSLLAKADVLIHQRDDVPTYDVYVLCSYARYLWDWLVDAAKEFD